MDDCKKQLLENCKSIAATLENPPLVLVDDPALTPEDEGWTYDEDEEVWRDEDGEDMSHELQPMSASDYLAGALDIEYRVGSDREYRSAEVLVAFGGPNIYIDTGRSVVIGAWWGDRVEVPYTDEIGLDEALQELFAC